MSALEIKRDENTGKIWSHVRSKWLAETPEETVRQEYLLVLVNEYGFSLDQIAEEMGLTGRGSSSARADFVIWRTAQDKADEKAPFIIVECKSDNVTIKSQDYDQGENYVRICGAPFFVTHNSRATRYWRIKKDKMPGYTEEIENIPHGDASDKDIEDLLSKLRIFKEREFADLLEKCHNIIRDKESTALSTRARVRSHERTGYSIKEARADPANTDHYGWTFSNCAGVRDQHDTQEWLAEWIW